MTKREGPGKDQAQMPDGPSAKRPHATLDLKATEVSSTPGKTAEQDKDLNKDPSKQTATASTQPGASSGTADTAQVKPSAFSKASPDSAPPKTGATPKAEQTRSNQIGGTSARASVNGPVSSNGFTRFLSHLAAGVAGGMLTLAGTSALQPKPTDNSDIAALTQATESLRQRLDKVTTVTNDQTAAAADLSIKFAETGARLSQLQKIEQSVNALSDSLAKVAHDQTILSEKFAQTAADNSAITRIGKLEDQLSTIASSATNEPNAGPIPQLAAVAGKIADLESTIANQTSELRKNVLDELDKRMADIREKSEAARSATSRFDRDLAQVKTDAVRLGQQFDIAKTISSRLDEQLRGLRDTNANLAAMVDELKSDVNTRLKNTARPADVTSAVEPLSSRIASLETDVKSVVIGEDARKTNAARIVLSLELANLKRLLDAGRSYEAALAEVKKAAGDKIDLSALEKFKSDGVPTLSDLTREFRPIANAVSDTTSEQTEGSVVDRLLSSAKSVVRVRRTHHAAEDQSVDAILGRMSAALKDGHLDTVLAEAKKLPTEAVQPAQSWISKVQARVSVDRAVSDIERQLKASLTGAEVKSSTDAVQ